MAAAPVAVGDTVMVVKPKAGHEKADAVVVAVRDGHLPLEGGGRAAAKYYELQWPEGGTTWHLRHEFEPLPDLIRPPGPAPREGQS